MKYHITGGVQTPLTLNENDPVASALQNVEIILRTVEGTVPLYRDFGISSEYLHKPTPAAAALLLAEIKEKVELFEPRVTVLGIRFEQSENGLIPNLEVEIRE